MTDSLSAYILSDVTEAADTMRRIRDDGALHATLEAVASRCVERLRAGHTILLCGNGGSAADAQHLAAELVNRFAYDRPGLPAFALTTDASVLTSISNDYGYEQVFARQIEAVARPGDVLIGLSTSGKSPNVIAALRAARARRLVTVGMTGEQAADMASCCDYLLQVPASKTARIQEGHILIGHVLCGLVEREMHPPRSSS
jgi:D-sedoheptulose 7-phosphate isomerase